MQPSPTQSLKIDFTQDDGILQVFSRLPILSSRQAAWERIHLGHYQQPAHETPEYCPAQHTISIHLGSSGIEEQWWEGRFRQEHFVYGDISIYPAGCPQKQRWRKDFEFLELNLDPTLFSQAVYESINPDRLEILPYRTAQDPLIQHIGLALRTSLESSIAVGGGGALLEANRLYVETMVNALVVHLLKHYTTQKAAIQSYAGGLSLFKLKVTIAHLQAHLDQNLSLSEIAAVVQMSPHYFASLFKQSTGQTPHQYVLSCRIERAKHLLAQRELAIADISQQVGFQNQSHFTSVFRKYVKVTPKAYRNSL
ncbi:helix-turn-helix transcriptional regulator [Leptolyngbya sp. FACHB-541]|uniref:AraC family transcriptional regulator n=1 Tax=Leptolyngbya sp. FACHB-541 TaxID=2692810 RepID=UPI001682DD2A|nr:AraC family transcriptional regulator [Leptolyngbya sp. FACHB-541]MBD1996955.1 helix-turn-helix transcriptional regulator [Leptolyngbya sp. FACHB-541]